MNRFVRFVSTPEVLERVYTLESEILQIEEAISIQSNKEISIHPVSFTVITWNLDFFFLECSSFISFCFIREMFLLAQ